MKTRKNKYKDKNKNQIQKLIDNTYKLVDKNKKGKVATYIPELAKANPHIFGICFITCNGEIYQAGDANVPIPIESISKVFALAMAVDEFGQNEIDNKIGNVGSSLPFNSIIATVLSPTHTINPFVNPGAIATVSLFYNKNKRAFEKKILSNMDNYAGKKLKFLNNLYKSEASTNSTNMAIGHLLKSFNKLYGEVDDSVDVYIKQCSVATSAKDLATMACVFATGGIHPFTNKKIISEDAANYTY